MMTRQVVVAATDSFETPWMRARGNERDVVVRGLREGESVLLNFSVNRQLQVPIPIESNGRFPFPKCTEFKFRKQVNGGPRGETYVEIEGV